MSLIYGQHPQRAMPIYSWAKYSRVGGTVIVKVIKSIMSFVREKVVRSFEREEVDRSFEREPVK